MNKRFLSLLLALAMVLTAGFTLTAASADDKPTISVAILDRGQVPPEKGTYENNDVTAWINEHSPVNVNFVAVPRSETATKYNIWLAAGEAPDLFMEFQPEMVQGYVNQGVLTELSAYIDEFGPNIRALTPPEVAKWGMYNDGEYAIPQIRSKTSVANWMMYIRQDWLDKLGLEMPTTPEELDAVIRAFRDNDPDGNGQKDTYGYSLGWMGRGLMHCIFGAMDNNWIPEDGQFQHVDVSRAKRDAYTWMRALYQDGYLDPEFITDTTGAKCQQDFATGKLGILASGVGYINNMYPTLMANSPDAVVVPMPSVGVQGYYTERECSFLNTVPTTCKNPAAVVQYLDWMISEGWETVAYGTEGVHYVKEEGVIINIADTDLYNKDVVYRNEYAVVRNENLQPEDLAIKYSRSDALIQASRAIEADAIRATFEKPYIRYTPTNDLGLEVVTSYLPDLTTISGETWLKAITDANYTADEALEFLLNEWDALDYAMIKDEFNAKAAEMGLSAEK